MTDKGKKERHLSIMPGYTRTNKKTGKVSFVKPHYERRQMTVRKGECGKIDHVRKLIQALSSHIPKMSDRETIRAAKSKVIELKRELKWRLKENPACNKEIIKQT